MQPETRYARSGDYHIAYQVVGSGPIDLVVVPGWVSNVEAIWEDPASARFYERLASFSRLIVFDKLGTGMSDQVRDHELPTLEQRMDDVRAVMDAAGSGDAALLGYSEGGAMSVLFAATYPERTSGLILYGSYARRLWAPDHPWGPTAEQRQAFLDTIERSWGSLEMVRLYNPSAARDPVLGPQNAATMRRAASPGAALALARMNAQIDVRDILPAVRVPTLVMFRSGDPQGLPGYARYLAAHITGAHLIELPGDDHSMYLGDTAPVLDEIEEFLTGTRPSVEIDRVLATVLFTDIVGSTEQLAELGDRRWSGLLEEHFRLARREVSRHRGREVKNTGDGLLATFDGPARAIRCASAVRDAVRQLGIEIRAGLHTGEIEVLGDDIGGIAVHTGARVAAEAGPGEVLVSSTVKDLVAGSGIAFDDRGVRVLKGVPGEWRLFAVASA